MIYNPYSYNNVTVSNNYPFVANNTTTTGYNVPTHNANNTK